MKYVSIDLETTGLNIERCQILEVGLVVDDLSWPDVVGEGPFGGRPHFRVLIDNDGGICGEAFALQMNQKILLEIAKGGDFVQDSYEADENIADFLSENFKAEDRVKGKIVAAGKNVASFDIPFLKTNEFSETCKLLHHRSIDPAMCFWQKGDLVPPSLSECLKRAGIEEEVSHTACEDAWQVIRLLRNKLR